MDRGIYHLIYFGIVLVLILIIIFSFLVYYIVQFANSKIHKELITLKIEQTKLLESLKNIDKELQNKKE